MKISVIIPAYNREHLISPTIRSLLDQSVPAGEIIVVDDGSTDRTAEVAESFGQSVRVLRQPNSGPAVARNTGFRESSGEFVHFFDSDDIAMSNKHEVQLQALETTGADIAYGPWVKGRIKEQDFEAENHVLQQNGLPKGDLIQALLTKWSIVPHACLFRRSIVEKIGGFPEELFGVEDQHMFMRCLFAEAKVVHSPGTLELYRANALDKITSADHSAKVRHQREWARFLVIAQKECLDHGIDPAVWFGYRQRVWEAAKDIENASSDQEALLAELGGILKGRGSDWRYAASRWLQQKRGGIQKRMTGGRSGHCFKGGHLTPAQSELIRQWKGQE